VYLCNREFEKNAYELLEELYELDQDKSHELLRRPLKTWKGSKNVFELADKAGVMDFMKHDCCQTELDKIWHGKLTSHPAWWKVVLNTLRFIAIDCFILKLIFSTRQWFLNM